MRINRNELFNSAGYLGGALLIGGYLHYAINEVLNTFNKSLMIAGAVLLIAVVIFNFAAIRSYFRRRSSRLGTNTVVMTGAVIAIIGVVNVVGYRHHKRIDLTSEQLYSLSDQTRKIVSSLSQDVQVIKFAREEDQLLKDRMQEYRDISKRITYERIDPQDRPDVAKKHGITHMGETIVVAGGRTERLEETGEQALTNAILKVTRDKLKKICFVEGHGEKPLSPAETDQGENYSAVDRALKNENYETQAINLVTSRQVPSDCDVLVIAGPKQGLLAQETAMIGKYLEGGGKAMLLLDPETNPNLGDVLNGWGIKLGDDLIVDQSAVGLQLGQAVPIARAAGSHPITKDFGRSMMLFPLARSVSTSSGGEARATELLKTSDESFAKTDYKDGRPDFIAGKDKRGPITIAAAATKLVGDKESRLLVIGDSDFAANAYVENVRNGDLFLNSINWLAQDEELISIRAKSPTDRKITMTGSQTNMLFWLTIVFMPVAVIGSGVYIWWKRR
ncbi:MAG TPA: GldG family protein [Blastocatellia bacterium]|nr:GldG family protein [Blastocatellia bacterium]